MLPKKTRIVILFCCINYSDFKGFPPLRKTVSPPQVKNYDNFLRVFLIANHLQTRHSLYLANEFNEWQRAPFLERELSRLLLVSKMFI